MRLCALIHNHISTFEFNFIIKVYSAIIADTFVWWNTYILCTRKIPLSAVPHFRYNYSGLVNIYDSAELVILGKFIDEY